MQTEAWGQQSVALHGGRPRLRQRRGQDLRRQRATICHPRFHRGPQADGILGAVEAALQDAHEPFNLVSLGAFRGDETGANLGR